MLDVKIYGSCSWTGSKPIDPNRALDRNWLHHLKGGWAFALGQGDQTILATDRWGTRPLYYSVQNNRIHYSENLDELYLSLSQPTFNEDVLARFLLEDFSHPEETMINEVKKVEPGTVLVFNNGRIQKSKWADDHGIVSQEHDFSATATLWHEELLHHLTTILPLHQKWGVFVSGGLDSSGLVALSMDLIKKHQWPIEIELYNLATDHPESDDQGFCKKLAERYQIPLHTHQTSPQEIKDLYSQWKKRDSTLPFFPTLQMFEPLMKRAAQNQCTGLLFGYGADEQWTLPPQTLALDFLTQRQWSLFLKTFKTADSNILHLKRLLKLWAQHKAPDAFKKVFHALNAQGLPSHLYTHQVFKKQRKELKNRIQASASVFTSYSQKQLFLRNYLSGNNTYNLSCHISLAAIYGLKVYTPYLSSEMLDLSLQSPNALFLNAQNKKILRELLKNSLLEEIRLAPKFQDYCHLAHKTALLLQSEVQDYCMKKSWIKSGFAPQFDDDSFFEILFVNKLSNLMRTLSNGKTSPNQKQN